MGRHRTSQRSMDNVVASQLNQIPVDRTPRMLKIEVIVIKLDKTPTIISEYDYYVARTYRCVT